MAIRDETSFCARITSTDDIGYDPPRLRLRSGIKKFDPRPRELNLAVKDNMKYACTRVQTFVIDKSERMKQIFV